MSQLTANLHKFLIKKSESLLEGPSTADSESCEVNISSLLADIRCLEYDLGKLKAFIEDSDLTQKIMYFSLNQLELDSNVSNKNSKPSSSSGLERDQSLEKRQPSTAGSMHTSLKVMPKTFTNIEKIFGFCLGLIKGYKFDSTVVLIASRSSRGESSLTYYPLDISPLFCEVVNQAHCVLFAGGTMKPKGLLEEVLRHSRKKVESRDFPSVIDEGNICCTVVDKLPGSDLLFSHANAGNQSANFKAVADLLVAIDSEITGGIVIFFASYAALQAFKSACFSFLSQHVDRSLIFDSDKAWDQYKNAVQNKSGKAMLFSVMGGKLSEGINFKDNLGRLF